MHVGCPESHHFLQMEYWACPATRMLLPSFCLVFFLPSNQEEKNQGGELSNRPSCATFLLCLVQDRCLGFEPVENKASSWLLYFKQERPPTSLHIPFERENKWLSSFPGTSAQEELFGKQPFHSAHELPLDGSRGIRICMQSRSRGKWRGECARMAGNHKSPL